jgi:2-phospho-L-lactate/phosphoenolpyruvate guanylyltransferase
MTADLTHIVAVVPVRSLSGAKSRLGEPLDAEERAELVSALLRRVVTAALGSDRLAGAVVVSPDDGLLDRAGELGARVVRQDGDGLNEGLVEARARVLSQGATAVLILPADLPGATTEAIDGLVESAERASRRKPGRPLVALAPDRHGTGTNALLVSPPGAIEFRFGEGSRAAHRAEAERVGAAYVETDGPLAFDLDTPDDLLAADLAGLDHEAGR